MKKASLQLRRPNFTLVLLSLILLFTLFTGTTFAETIVRVMPQDPVAASNEDFTVNIYVEPDEPVAGIQFDFTFDSSLADVKNVREGTLLKQADSSTMFRPGEDESSKKGTIEGIYGFILGKSAASAPGTFATIDLTPTGGQGVCKLQLSNVVISDSSGHAVSVKVVNGTVRIKEELAPSSGISSEITQSSEVLTEELTEKEPTEEELTEEELTEEELVEKELVEKELTEGPIEKEPKKGTLEEGIIEGYQEGQSNQPASQGVFSEICNFFRDLLSK